MKHFKLLMIIIGTLASMIFIALIASLLQRDHIEFTNDDTIDVPVIYASDPMNGSSTPSVLIVHFGDHASDNSADISEHLTKLLEKYPEDIMIIWKDFPNYSLRPEAYTAAIAAHCAQDQHHFTSYQNFLIDHQYELNQELYIAIAKEIGLRENKFERCLRKEKTADQVNAGITQAEALNLTSAPTLFINDTRYTGALSYFELETIILNIIAK